MWRNYVLSLDLSETDKTSGIRKISNTLKEFMTAKT